MFCICTFLLATDFRPERKSGHCNPVQEVSVINEKTGAGSRITCPSFWFHFYCRWRLVCWCDKRATRLQIIYFLIRHTSQWKSLLSEYQKVSRYTGTAVAQWLRYCATHRKVAGSIPTGVSGISIDIKFFRSHYGPGVDSDSNRNEYQEHSLRIKAAGA